MIQSSFPWAQLARFEETIKSNFDTPCYVYSDTMLRDRTNFLTSVFGDHFDLSFAIKSNPNKHILKTFQEIIENFDASSIGEVERAVYSGISAQSISFSGPAKKPRDLEKAVALGVGELIIESAHEAETVSSICVQRHQTQPILLRINPSKTPKQFGASMTGKSSQFGIDEGTLAEKLQHIISLPGLSLEGFHIYSGSNCLSADAIIENFHIMADSFTGAAAIADIHPRKLIFGSGFGVPYFHGDEELDIIGAAEGIKNVIQQLKTNDCFASTQCTLELGRWLIAPCGVLLTSVVSAKSTQDREIRLCDAGFNNHLAACGLMGTVIRRNWKIKNISKTKQQQQEQEQEHKYTLVGPLCTSIDVLAQHIVLPETHIGDILAIPMSGAYGLTASPIHFISHPIPSEVMIVQNNLADISQFS